MRFRSVAKSALFGLSYHARTAVLCDLVRGTRIRLLIYHGIPTAPATDAITNLYGYNLTVDEFEEHVDYLARRCNVVSLQRAIEGRGLSRTRMNVVVTFDDGYENNATNAFRVLEQRGLPAVYAIATDFVLGRTPLWNDVVEYAVTRSVRRDARLAWRGETHEWDLSGVRGRVALYDWLLTECTTMPQEERGELLDAMLDALDVDGAPEAIFAVDDYRPLSPDQVRALARSELAEVASHSVHHNLLTRTKPETRTRELADSKKAIEELTGRPCTTFCVPGGQYDDALVKEALDLGYTAVLTSDGGVVTPGRNSPRVMGRLGILNRTPAPIFSDLVHGPVGATLRRALG